jgi:hypothetical protein
MSIFTKNLLSSWTGSDIPGDRTGGTAPLFMRTGAATPARLIKELQI